MPLIAQKNWWMKFIRVDCASHTIESWNWRIVLLSQHVTGMTEKVLSYHPIRVGIFTIGALDNLDHNPSSSTATTSFHGTGISIFQIPDESNRGISRSPDKISKSGKRNIALPESYEVVPVCSLNRKYVRLPPSMPTNEQSNHIDCDSSDEDSNDSESTDASPVPSSCRISISTDGNATSSVPTVNTESSGSKCVLVLSETPTREEPSVDVHFSKSSVLDN